MYIQATVICTIIMMGQLKYFTAEETKTGSEILMVSCQLTPISQHNNGNTDAMLANKIHENSMQI